jgi:hypothetical protein
MELEAARNPEPSFCCPAVAAAAAVRFGWEGAGLVVVEAAAVPVANMDLKAASRVLAAPAAEAGRPGQL